MGAHRGFTLTRLALAVVLLVCWVSHAEAAGERRHALAFKTGYHYYPSSSYFRASEESGAGGTTEFQGQSLELLDYTYQYDPTWGLNLTFFGGYFRKYTPRTDDQQSLVTTYATITPIYRLRGSDRIGRWLVYTGLGVGRYTLTLRFDFQGSSPEFSNFTLGYHALLGAEYRFSEQVGFLAETKYARARVKFDDDLARLDIDLGGLNLLVGFRIHF